jgi:uncharacterized protein (TIGR02118 family)
LIKLDILAVRRHGMTLEEFVNYWRDEHGPFFVQQPIVKKTVRRYVQSRLLSGLPAALPEPPYDGIVQLWFDDMAGFFEYIQSDNYQQVIKLDEAKFVDHEKVKLVFSEEFELIAPAS